MTRPRVLVLRSPGTNCNEESAHAFTLAGGVCEQIHIQRLLEVPSLLMEFQILCLPGGFSYGDDLGAGTMMGQFFRRELAHEVRTFRDRDRLILGICNGFQILLKSGLLVEDDPASGLPRATLALNRQGRFETRWVHVRVERSRCAFLQASQEAIWMLPVAHAEGNFTTASPSTLDALQQGGKVAVRYVDPQGRYGDFPINPNGSEDHIAGICDSTGRVFAMMPHPERHVSPYQHPSWTRRKSQPEEGDGLAFFRSAVRYFQ